MTLHRPSRLTTGVAFASSLFVAAAALSTVNPTQPAEAAVHPARVPAAQALSPGAVERLVAGGAEVRLTARALTRHPH
jgi:hypothetical protein